MSNLFQRLAIAFYVRSRMRKTLKLADKYGFDRRLAWREMQINYKVRKNHPVRYIPLGYDCIARTVLTEWLLKPDRSCGEKGMVFDRAKHSTKAVADLLEKDFAGYFENWRYNPAPAMKCWFNFSQTTSEVPLPTTFLEAREGADYMYYYHDRDCGPDDLEKLKKRTKGRLELFLDTLNHPGNYDLYILHKWKNEKTENIERMCRLIREKRGSTPTHILVFVTDARDLTEEIEGAETIRCIYPYRDSSWGEHNIHKRLHVFFTVKFVRACRKYVLEHFPAVGSR